MTRPTPRPRPLASLTGLATLALAAASLAFAPAAHGQAKSITFEAGKVIEVAFAKVKPGMMPRLQNEYFAKVIPIAREYGLEPLGTFPVSHVDHGPGYGLFGFFEWPSVERKHAFERDPRFAPLRELRDSMFEKLPVQLYTRVAETTTVTLKPGAIYEAAAVWVNAHRVDHLNAYFDAAGPFIAESGVTFHGPFEVIGQSDKPRYAFDALPDRFLFIEWPDAETKQDWFTSEAFKQAGWNRALALDRLIVLESAYAPPADPSAEAEADTPPAAAVLAAHPVADCPCDDKANPTAARTAARP